MRVTIAFTALSAAFIVAVCLATAPSHAYEIGDGRMGTIASGAEKPWVCRPVAGNPNTQRCTRK